MFSCTDPDAADAAIASASSTAVGAAAREHLRASRQHEARSLLAAYRLGQSAYDDMLMSLSTTQQMTVRGAADKTAVGEISLQLGFSRTKAGTWFNLGDALQRLPKIRMAYLAGDFSTHRMSKMVYAAQLVPDLNDAPDAAPTLDFEDLALELESRPTTDKVFTDQLAETVISLDPDGAAHAREEFAHTWQNLTITADSSGHMNLDGCVPAEDGVHRSQRISTLIAERLCRRDPRRIGQQRVTALAEITGVPGKTLTCHCGHNDCPRHPTPEPTETTEPTDPVDPSEPSDNGDNPVTTPPTAVPPNPPTWTLVSDPTGIAVPRLRGYGAIDPALAATLAENSTLIAVPEEAHRRPSGLIVGDRGPAPPVDPTGHGGFDHPPPGALTYTPSRRLRDQILHTDLWCRYPLCGKPSHECELDHLVTFNHADPQAGGWTVAFNLAPLCTPDHHRKHLGLWLPTMHTDRTITWHNPTTGEEIVTYPR
ncbi:HNH endonuclease signature motif containing protein [Gordonia sp. SL306]|uniref:HNH endonuclease signature motif containing protein n=1 Tax=Gordonia sp. SL306 TaxID=2995145 RepID=UPI002271294D|nr:HNH endonuclease signature motif containing protein [Gordonia sp. SL306]WAC57372.1 HNH endonuclease [Gordonia sp. SL306]